MEKEGARKQMKNKTIWSRIRIGLLSAALIASLGLSLNLYQAHRLDRFAESRTLDEAMKVVQSADSQTQGAINVIEGGAGAAESLYAIGTVQSRLAEASGRLLGLGGAINDSDTDYAGMARTLININNYLGNTLTAGWQEGDAALQASRDKALVDLRSLKQDLAQLANLAQGLSGAGAYDTKDFSDKWTETFGQRMREDPDSGLHQTLSSLYE